MAINRLLAPTDPPTANADWTRLNALVSALALHQEQPLRIIGSNVVKGALFQIGGTLYLADADTAITGTPSNYVKITPSGDGSTCSASYVSSLTGVTWSSTYNGYYDSGSPASLYIFDEGKAYTAGQIASFRNTKNQVVPMGSGWLAVLANSIGSGWLTAIGAALASGWATAFLTAYTEPADRAAADATKAPLQNGNNATTIISAGETIVEALSVGELISYWWPSGTSAYLQMPAAGTYKVLHLGASGAVISYKVLSAGDHTAVSSGGSCMIERLT